MVEIRKLDVRLDRPNREEGTGSYVIVDEETGEPVGESVTYVLGDEESQKAATDEARRRALILSVGGTL